MPEYIWLGLILLHYGRKKGLKKAASILYNISKEINSLSHPKLSMIFGLPEEEQNKVFKIIVNVIDKDILSPLTVLYRSVKFPLFNEFFNNPQLKYESRVQQLIEAIRVYSPPQVDEATDLRFLALCLLLFGGKIHMPKEMNISSAFEEYSDTDHKDEKMKMYRPTIRSMEGITFGDEDNTFSLEFWRNIGMITTCKPVSIVFDESKTDYKSSIVCFQKILEYVLQSNKERSLAEDKFDVIVGSVTYALKIFIEIEEKVLGNSILARHGARTITEVFIILKYLLMKENTNPNIWEEYKLYGISKYKLILLKSRELPPDDSSHFIAPIADALVNEIKWEEFIDIDLKYFDKQGIREKSIEVGEKYLYDIYYDYDSSYAHGLWGAIRESAMLHCNNPTHLYHSIPDIYSKQALPDAKADSFKILGKLFSILINVYEVPETLFDGSGLNI